MELFGRERISIEQLKQGIIRIRGGWFAGAGFRFQSLRFCQQLGQQGAVFVQYAQEFFYGGAMFRRRLREFDAHALVRMHDPHHSLGPHFHTRGAHRQGHARRRRKWRCNFQIACAHAQIGKLATDRRIVRLGFGRILFEPFPQLPRRLRRDLLEAQSRLIGGPFPGKLSGKLQRNLRSG